MDDLLETPWLFPFSETTTEQINNLDINSSEAWQSLRIILQSKLPTKEINKLWKKLSAIEADTIKALRLAQVKVVFAGAAVFEHMEKELWVSCLRNNIFLKIHSTDFNQVAQISYTADETVVEFNPDIVFLYEDTRSISDVLASGDKDMIDGLVEQSLSFAQKFQQNYNAITMLNTLVTPIDSYQSDADLTYSQTIRNGILHYNTKLVKEVENSSNFIFDIAQLAANIGIWRWGNPNYWHLAKMPFDPSCITVFSERFSSLIAAYNGKSRRVLVLDCDNTLWGGVIGDDGIAGLKIGQGSATGEAFLDIQRTALALRSKGIVLAISSKNTEDVAITVFREHPDMLLREKDITIFRINWTDKASNIADIAKTLDLGLQSFVFLDDNPAERERVRQALPEVAVPEVGDNPADYPAYLIQAGYFNTTFFSDEDQRRADMYSANTKRAETFQTLGNMDAYLESLEMKISLKPFDAVGRTRIAQLITKSNQFNLTTFRLSAAEVEEAEKNPYIHDLQIRLIDKFGDNGMISVVMAEKQNKNWDIKLWLMSCRVLSRRVEEYVIYKLVTAAKKENVETLTGYFIPSDRNSIVAEHYKKLGFTLLQKLDDGSETWQLKTDSYISPDLPFFELEESN